MKSQEVNCKAIKRIVEQDYKLEIDGRHRDRPSTEARFIYAKLCRDFAVDWHEVACGREIRRHRTSVIYYLNQSEDLWDLPTFREHKAHYYNCVRKIKVRYDMSRRPAAHNRAKSNMKHI